MKKDYKNSKQPKLKQRRLEMHKQQNRQNKQQSQKQNVKQKS